MSAYVLSGSVDTIDLSREPPGRDSLPAIVGVGIHYVGASSFFSRRIVALDNGEGGKGIYHGCYFERCLIEATSEYFSHCCFADCIFTCEPREQRQREMWARMCLFIVKEGM